jgi:thymidylate synthase
VIKDFKLHKDDANTLVCQSFGDAYGALATYIRNEGYQTQSRLGLTREVLNFKTVIMEPLKRCTVALNRNCNIFFHRAESLWIICGRNDLDFIRIFNSKFHEFSDDGVTLHGAYGKRIRGWQTAPADPPVDQLRLLLSTLNKEPDSRRSVVSLWNPMLDLGTIHKDIPCNTQLAFRIAENNLILTVFNRSNDLHWGYIANIFQFSFVAEVAALLLNKRFHRQTHLSQSLHIYESNDLQVTSETSAACGDFYHLYNPSSFLFNFESSSLSVDSKLKDMDKALGNCVTIILKFFHSSRSFSDVLSEIMMLRGKSRSLYEIMWLLLLYTDYRKAGASKVLQTEMRIKCIKLLVERNGAEKFIHQDYYALALNYFIKRTEANLRSDFILSDPLIGSY